MSRRTTFKTDEGAAPHLGYGGGHEGNPDGVFDSMPTLPMPDLPGVDPHHPHAHHPHHPNHLTAAAVATHVATHHAHNEADAEAAALAAAAMGADPTHNNHLDGGGMNLGDYHHPHHGAAPGVAVPPALPPIDYHPHHPQAQPQQQHNLNQHHAPPPPAAMEVPRPQIVPMPEVMIPPKWMGRYEELKKYKEEHGNFNVPKDTTEELKQLHGWIRTQKQQFKMLYEGKPNHMSQARINLLNEIGFEWSGEKRDKFWHDRYHELLQFHSKNGTTRIPPDHPNSQLHTWVSLQRRQLKMYKEGKPTKLTQERIRMLEAVGVECNIRASTTWMDRFMELKRYKDEHGDCDVPQKWKENPSLGRWVDNQKTQHKKLYDGKPTHMTIERIQLLVTVGFNFRRGN